MMGYDRPLKPEWIYTTLRTIEPGHKPEEFYGLYDNIAVELTGKDGRRKTRTVLYRTFIYSFQDSDTVVQDNVLIRLCKTHDIEFAKPVLLAKFILDYPILKYFTEQLYRIFDPSQDIPSAALIQKMTAAFGDSEIIRRSTRSFFKTLCDFGILESKDAATFRQLPRRRLSPEQISEMLRLFSDCRHAHQVDIAHFAEPLFVFYEKPDLDAIAMQFHGSEWEYVKGLDRGVLMMNAK